MTTHISILAWRIPETEKPGGCSPSGHKEPDTTERLSTAQHGCYIGELLFSLHVYFTSH